MKRSPSMAASAATCCAALLALSACATAPHPGAPAAITGCRVIDQSGAYVLAADLPGAGGYLTPADHPDAVEGDCLLVVVSGVDLDLAGHVIAGDGNNTTDGSGVHATTGFPRGEHINVYNGLIRGFYRGINFEGVFFSTVENITAVDNDNHGISIHAGQSNHIRDNRAISNANAGLRVSTSSVVTDNIVNGNGGAGLFVDERSVVIGNTAWMNGGNGIAVNCPSLVEGNVTSDSGGSDLLLQGVPADCVAVNNVVGP